MPRRHISIVFFDTEHLFFSQVILLASWMQLLKYLCKEAKVNWGQIFVNLIQKRQTVMPDNQLAREIQSISIRGLGMVTSCGGQSSPQNEGLGGQRPPNRKKSQNFTTKSIISQKLEITKIKKLIFHSFQHIGHLSCRFDPF